jgi:acetyl/propionyl-CoA carboxylase alpha subunit
LSPPFPSLLVANRGEIACRIFRTARTMGMRTIAVYSDADAKAKHVREADVAVHIGASPAADSYLRADKVLAAAEETGAAAIHPGYGFLSENPAFAEAVIAAGLIWVGPTPDAIRAMGLKDEAKRIAIAAGVPVLAGYQGEDQSEATLLSEAKKIGFPVLIKAVAGGGGRGIREVKNAKELREQLLSAQREAKAAFGDDRVLIEKLVERPRHIEVQVFGDKHGGLVHVFERDCSLQRRRQKVIEEAPAPGMTDEVRAAMTEAALKVARAVKYENAGTVEFIVDGNGPLRPDGFWFLEMNTRLQVEHPVTEHAVGLATHTWRGRYEPTGEGIPTLTLRGVENAVHVPGPALDSWQQSLLDREFGSEHPLLDLVEWQLRVAAGAKLPVTQDQIFLFGCAIQARLCAENPAEEFRPSVGKLHTFFVQSPHRTVGGRVDAGFETGDTISPAYDSLVAKVIAADNTREEARHILVHCLSRTHTFGLKTNAGFLVRCLEDEGFKSGDVHTGLIVERLAELTDRGSDRKSAARAWALKDMQAASRSTDPWSSTDGWRLNAPVRRRWLLECHGETFDIDLPAEIDFDEFGASWLWPGETAGEEILAEFHELNGSRFVVIGGETFTFTSPGASADHDAGGGGDDIKAPLPGKIVALATKAGAAVKKGEVLVTLEAMKMEHALKAPRDGVVAEVAAVEGAQVAEGAVLVRLEPAG